MEDPRIKYPDPQHTADTLSFAESSPFFIAGE